MVLLLIILILLFLFFVSMKKSQLHSQHPFHFSPMDLYIKSSPRLKKLSIKTNTFRLGFSDNLISSVLNKQFDIIFCDYKPRKGPFMWYGFCWFGFNIVNLPAVSFFLFYIISLFTILILL